MAYEIGKIVGLLAGFALGILIYALLNLYMNDKNKQNMRKYDERQELERGRAYKTAFYVMLIYFITFGIFDSCGYKLPMDLLSIVLIGIVISTIILGIYLVSHDAYFSLRENPKRVFLSIIFIGILNILLGILQFTSGDVIVDGVLTYRCANIVVGIGMFVLAMGVFVVLQKMKKEEAECEEKEEDDEEP